MSELLAEGLFDFLMTPTGLSCTKIVWTPLS